MTDRQIQVSKLPRNVSEDLLSNFFENPRIFSKDIEVEGVQLRGGKAIVTLKDAAHVDCIFDVHAKKACKLSECEIDIRRVTTSKPSSGQSGTQPHQDDNEGDDDDESSTIEVHGLSDSITDELAWNYFENRYKAGGGEIIGLKRNGETAYIKYKDKQVAFQVVQKSHKLSGCDLSVKLLIISKDSLLLTNLPAEISEETLINYAEAKLQEEVVSITFDQEQTKALVAFKTDIDFEQALRKISQAPLQKATLNVQEVPVSSSIMVTNMADGETRDSIVYYFENKNKSGGGPVDKVEMFEDDGYCTVHFENTDDALSVCKKKNHKLSGNELKVQQYNRILGVPYGGTQLKFKLPSPVHVSPDQTLILTLTKQRCLEKISEIAEKVQANIDWETKPLEILCTIKESDKNCRSLTKTWNKRVVKSINEFTDGIEIYRCPLPEPVWAEARTQLQSFDVKEGNRTALKFIGNELILVAPKQDMAVTKTHIRKAIETGERNIKKQNERTTEEVDLKKSWKANYLKCIDLSTADEIEIGVDIERHKAVFTGPKEKVTEAKLYMYDQLNQIKSKTLRCDQGKANLLRKPKIYKMMKNKISEQGDKGVLELMGNTVVVHAKDETSQQQIEDIFNKTLACVEIPFSRNSLTTFHSRKWDEFKHNMIDTFDDCIDFELSRDEQKLRVFTLEELLPSVHEQIKEFLDKNTMIDVRVEFKNEDAVKFVERFCKEDIRHALGKCNHKVQYKFDCAHLSITGNV